jgi:hypothetical protein
MQPDNHSATRKAFSNLQSAILRYPSPTCLSIDDLLIAHLGAVRDPKETKDNKKTKKQSLVFDQATRSEREQRMKITCFLRE